MAGFIADLKQSLGVTPQQLTPGGFLGDFINSTAVGQKAIAQREAQAARERQAAAFDAIQSGDVMGAAAYDPQLAGDYQGVQAGQQQLGANKAGLEREALLRTARAVRAAEQRLGDRGVAFDLVVPRVGKLLGGSPEEIASVREFFVGTEDPYGVLEASLTEAPNDKGRYISTRGGIFDTQTREIIANEDPEADLRRQLLQSQVGATDALADQRRSAASSSPVPVTKGQEQLDKTFAKEAVDFMQGGSSVAASNIARLDNAVEQLSGASGLTGPIAGIGNVNVRTLTNPKSAAVQQQVQNAIQESLKATLGAQFARVEGEQLLDRAFAPRQQEGENIRRVKIVANTLREMLQRKQEMTDYFMENGTLVGYEGAPPDPEVFNEILRQFDVEDAATENASVLSPEKQRRLEELQAKRREGTLQ